ncbi:MAG: BPTI/Kunitz-type proteinase inhibitor domain-containing protein [Thiohalocapsa sp.]
MHWHRRSMIAAAVLVLSACGSSPEEAGNTDALHVSCLEPPTTGTCRAAKPAFYYDYPSDSCKRFIWGGCGSKVPFQSLEQCVQTCGGRAAP